MLPFFMASNYHFQAALEALKSENPYQVIH